jgi:flavin reductase (DIM6/NTAB) family NADH-FMN oxidoreductase RutF
MAGRCSDRLCQAHDPARRADENAMTYPKKNFPVTKTRRFLEPGPIVLISSAWKDERNIMTLGWHMMLDYNRVGCFIWDQNHSFDLVRRSKQCVINLPTLDLIDRVIVIGNTHSRGRGPDKFQQFNLTPQPAAKVKAPLIAECYANFECKLIDTSLINKYSLFVLEVVKAHAATSPKYPTTVHYRGDGVFMISGRNASYRRRFKRVNL